MVDIETISGAVFAGVMLVILMVLLSTGGIVQEEIQETQASTASRTNDSITFIENDSYVPVTYVDIAAPLTECSCVGNATHALTGDNYTCLLANNSVKLILLSDDWGADIAYNCSYSHVAYEHAWNITNETATGIFNLAAQTPLIGTMIGLAIVLFLMLGLLWRKGKGGY